MVTSVMDKMKQLGQEIENKKAVDANIAYIMENRDDWIESFPNKWIVVDFKNLVTTREDFFDAARIMDRRGELTPTTVFYFSNNYRIPMIVHLLNVKES